MEILIFVLALLILGIVIGITINIFWLGFAAVLYFLPTIIAAYKKHPSILWIFLINLFFGWTFIGWLIPVLWAFDFDKVLIDFIEFRKQKAAKEGGKDTIIEGEVVSEDTNQAD